MVGGILSILIFTMRVISRPFIKLSMELDIVNSLFNFEL